MTDENENLCTPGGAGWFAPGQTLAGRYQIERELDRGAMGVVYIARDLQLLGSDSTRVVIKVLLAEAAGNAYYKKKFLQEFESLTRVKHPNVVKVLGRGELTIDGQEPPVKIPYFVMEYVEGRSLRKAIQPYGMPFDEVASILKQIGSGLTAVHDSGILHCDLKPANIMLQEIDGGEEIVKLIDFGVAKVKDSLVKAGDQGTRVMGTRDYASPEHYSGALTQQSDIFCLGLVAYEMLTGRRPFNAETDLQLYPLIAAGVQVMPSSLRPTLPPAAQELLLKALAVDPGARFQQAREFGNAMAKALGQPTTGGIPQIQAAPVPEPAPAQQQAPALRKKKSMAGLGLALAVVVLLAAGAYFGRGYWQSPSPTQQSPSQAASPNPNETGNVTKPETQPKAGIAAPIVATVHKLTGTVAHTPTNPLPAIESLSATPSSIQSGQGVLLEWKIKGATKVSMDGLGSMPVEQDHGAVCPTGSRTYVLTAIGPGGTVHKSVDVSVQIPAGENAKVKDFSAQPEKIKAGDSSVLKWLVVNASSVQIDPEIGQVDACGNLTVKPAATTKYKLSYQNASGASKSKEVTVTVK